jgi:hypothetical protein
MENLDLDINNYSLKDLETFFRLKSNSNYTSNDVELKEYQIREQLLKSGHIDKRFKRDLIEFLTTAKNQIINAKCKPNEKPPSSIYKNYKLDPLDTPLSRVPLSRETELIQRPETQYIYTNNSEYFPGVINPLNKRTITKCLNIDTKFRDSISTTNSSDFTIQLSTKLNKVVSMELAAIELPLTFYGISESNGNNFLYIRINHTTDEYDSLDAEKIFIIPDGNYNAVDLIHKINSIVSPKKDDDSLLEPDIIFSYLDFVLDITENGSGSGKVIIHTVGEFANTINSITLDFTRDIHGTPDSANIATRIGWNLGFIKPFYTGKIYYISDSVIESKNTRYIYLSIDDFNKSSNNPFISIFNQSILNDDVLARISIKGSHLSLVMDNDMTIVTEPRQYFGPVDIQRFRIRLFDEYGRILQMNGSNFSFCLKLNLLYDL